MRLFDTEYFNHFNDARDGKDHVMVLEYAISHSFIRFQTHKGDFFRREVFEGRGVHSISAQMIGGPYELLFERLDGEKSPLERVFSKDGTFEIVCDVFGKIDMPLVKI